jgi:hypothetical protein
MMTSAAALVTLPTGPRRADPVQEAVTRLGRALPARADATVLVDFLEDDLREGLDALKDVEAHFADVLTALRSGGLHPVSLREAGDEARVQQQLQVLEGAVMRIHRRMAQAAGMLRRPTT